MCSKWCLLDRGLGEYLTVKKKNTKLELWSNAKYQVLKFKRGCQHMRLASKELKREAQVKYVYELQT